MSETHSLVCHDCKVQMWTGQGEGKEFRLYTTTDHLDKLKKFFFDHQNHRLEYSNDSGFESLNYESLDVIK